MILSISAFGLSPIFSQQPIFASGDEVTSVETEAGPLSIKRIAAGLNHPWGLAFLPDGRLLVTERSGDLRILGSEGRLSDPVAGVPEVFAEGQGGLLDVALDPDFSGNHWIYLSYAEPRDGGATTALGRGKWQDGSIGDFEVIFRQEPGIDGDKHFGGRIVFAPDGNLFLTLGERYQFDPAQELSDHLGTIVRIARDGSVPSDNPFADREDARPEIWSYGHRNIESAVLLPETGELWVVEMGPRGGDELNLVEEGINYGWPEVSWGRHYDGRDIPDPPTRSEFRDAVEQYTPVISPSGMVYYDADVFPEWKGSVFVGGLSSQQLVRLEIENGEVAHEERIPLPERIRDVEQGPDGYLYLSTDAEDGEIWRVERLVAEGN